MLCNFDFDVQNSIIQEYTFVAYPICSSIIFGFISAAQAELSEAICLRIFTVLGGANLQLSVCPEPNSPGKNLSRLGRSILKQDSKPPGVSFWDSTTSHQNDGYYANFLYLVIYFGMENKHSRLFHSNIFMLHKLKQAEVT